ncbi:MAG: DUF1638 domain-containing protein [Candidatus Methanoplasma sp.]|jgi:hypothetical protein|nr:DUF1638 domain-containing protein [Candidatus Methanoplasma sp.]
MVKGTLGIIGCPILEDEMIFSLSSEKDEKKVYIVDTPTSRTLRKKLESKGVPFSVIDEWEFNNGYSGIDRDSGFNIVLYMNNLALHKEPEFLRRTLEDQLRFYQGRFDAIALYYGMCGNAGWDISKWASENLGIPVFVFRDDKDEVCDDCIGVAVGGHSRYCDFVRKYTGMFFVTPAIAENWGDYSNELNFTKGFEIMGISTVKEVFEVYGYKKAVRIDTGIGIGGGELDEGCRRFSDITGLEFVTAAPGSVDLYPTERIYRDAKGALGS